MALAALVGLGMVASGPAADTARAQSNRAQSNRDQGANVVQVKPGAVVPGRYIVVLRGNVADPRAVATEMAGTHGLGLGHVYGAALKGFAAAVPAGRLNALRRDPRVAYIEPDQAVQAFAEIPTGIRRIFADGNPNIAIDGIDDVRIDADVAVIDSGIDFDHPDLNVVARTNCAKWSGPCVDDEGDDGYGHGTHVAGTVAALDNDIGPVGVAPGARLHAVRVLGDYGTGYMSWLIAGVDWVAARSDTIKVANMSVGGLDSPSLCEAVSNAASKVAIVVAAGNSDTDAASFSPANCSGAITVSALADFDGLPGALGSPTCRTDEDDTLANFSNYGSLVDIAAPGVCIYSTWKNGGYNIKSGTSMASPHVAGAAALLVAGGITSPSDVKNTLLGTGNFDWIDQSGDGAVEPLLDVSDATVFNPADAQIVDPPPVNAAPTVTIASPANGDSFPTGTTINFSGGANDAEDGNVSASLHWYADGILIGTGTGFSAQLADGSHTIRAEATDSGGLTGESSVDISVTGGTPANTAPTVSITSPANGDSFTSGTTINFSGGANDAEDGNVSASLNWYADGILIGTGTGFSAQLADGSHTIRAEAADSGGLTGESSINVSVIEPPPANTAPTASIAGPANGDSFASGASISFSGSANDAEDGNVSASLNWYANGILIGTGASFSAVLADGSYTIRAEATDSGGLTGESSVNITVSGEPPAPTTVSVGPVSCRLVWFSYRLLMTVTVSGVDSGAPVPGATVATTISRDGGALWSPSGTTGSDGAVTFAFNRVASGTYTLEINGVTGDSLSWDGSQPDPNSCVK